ncbi:GNAT family N-acetyltransferase [Paenibacillus glucanolyticus]|uniref:Histone acetyltransferase n=2 Tax=Paenibacillus TaxID=44249 RepID=A0A163HA03_9BACL|nr:MULTISPECIES: GNAT family N-acetyltransferase [Paenibacillus]AWP25776.1 histone acetyltransferase [Paenibacillus sp. Cedars]KZS45385.1 histone acetyltransferase [Paenibacillus glucanolyticus]MDH6675567.1 GNAT superfamily N-acetyltransferase [Paenibacillus sp. LBL]
MINELSLEDRDTVQQIWGLQHMAYPLEAELIGFTDIPPLLDTFDTIRTSGETFFGYINDEGELIGAIAVEAEEAQVTISRMMVHPGHFRKGIAGTLIRHVLETYHKAPMFTVSTGTRNTPAVTLYEKFGFVKDHVFEVAPGVELTEFHLRIQ